MVAAAEATRPAELWTQVGATWATSPQQRRVVDRASQGLDRWTRYPVRRSGIGANGSGFEVSVRHERHGPTLRYIVDPLAYVTSPEQGTGIVQRHLRQWAPREVAAPGQALLDRQSRLFPVHAGTFLAWIGLAVAGTGATHGKLYLNPWLSGSRAGLLAAADIVSALGGGGLPTRRIAEVFDLVGPMVPHIVGVNLSAEGCSFKVYFCGPDASRRGLLALGRAWGLGTLCRLLEEPGLAEAGEVHVCLSCSPGQAPGSVSLHVPSWFSSSASAVRAVGRLVGDGAAVHWHGPPAALTPSFVGLARDSVTVYSRDRAERAHP